LGQDDRDWYRDKQRELEKQRQMDETRAKFSVFSRKSFGASVSKSASPAKAGLLPIIIVWCVVIGLLYALLSHYQKPKQAQVQANGDLVINRSLDGHFYVKGTVNGIETKFLVDTGASLVIVSEEFAQKALIRGGVSTTFHTANGDLPGRVVDNIGVSIGPVTVNRVRVGVGLRTNGDADALLGQSFLSKFDITMGKNQLVLRAR
jgi:aspartyl protease family protein